MNEISKTALLAGVGTAAVAFIGYCVYFDMKRRQDPDYKKKIRERKLGGQKSIFSCLCNNRSCTCFPPKISPPTCFSFAVGRRRQQKTKTTHTEMPNLADHEAVQR